MCFVLDDLIPKSHVLVLDRCDEGGHDVSFWLNSKDGEDQPFGSRPFGLVLGFGICSNEKGEGGTSALVSGEERRETCSSHLPSVLNESQA